MRIHSEKSSRHFRQTELSKFTSTKTFCEIKSISVSISVFLLALLSLYITNCCDRDEYTNDIYYKTDCSLTDVPSDIRQEAREVHLDENEITRVSSQTFSNLKQCTYLSMSQNKLIHVHLDMFNGLQSLEELVLKFNDIKDIDDGAFSHLTKCKTLKLNNNMLTTITQGMFDGLKSLENLNLQDNEIREINLGSFINLTQCVHLDLSGNEIVALPSNIFSGLDLLEELDLDIN